MCDDELIVLLYKEHAALCPGIFDHNGHQRSQELVGWIPLRGLAPL